MGIIPSFVNYSNPYARKLDTAVIRLVASFFLAIGLAVISSFMPEASIFGIFLAFIILGFLLSFFLHMYLVGYYGGRYATKADHKILVSALLFLTFSPAVWFGAIMSIILPGIKNTLKAYDTEEKKK